MLDGNFPVYSAKPVMPVVGVYQLTVEIFKTVSIFLLHASHLRDVKFVKGFKRSLLDAVRCFTAFHNDEGKAGI